MPSGSSNHNGPTTASSSTSDNNQHYFDRVTIGQAYGRMFRIFFQKFDVFLMLSALSYVPLAMFLLFLTPIIMSQTIAAANGGQQSGSSSGNNSTSGGGEYIPYDSTDPDPTKMSPALFLEVAIFMVVTQLLTILLNCIGSAAMAHVVGEMYLGKNNKQIDALTSLKWAWSQACSLLGSICMLGLVVGVPTGVAFAFGMYLTAHAGQNALYAIFGGLLLMLVLPAAFMLMIKFHMTIQAITIEKKGPIDGMKRSWELSEQYFCFLFCTLFVFFIVSNIVTSIFGNLVNSSGNSPMGMVLQTVVPGLFSHPLQSILVTILYMHFRIEKESLNADVLTHDLTGVIAINDLSAGKYAPISYRGDMGFGDNSLDLNESTGHVPLVPRTDFV